MSAIGVRCEGLSVAYGGRPVLRDVTFEARAGRITALIGPSGCGKSSLLAALNRLIEWNAGAKSTGAVFIGGEDAHAPGVDVRALRRRVGMIFQKPTPFPLSIRRNVELALEEHGIRDRAERTGRCETALRAVGLWDEVAHRLGESALALSGGQQQRLTIARALALEPEVLLLDEPCSALDPISSAVVEDLMTSLRGRYTLIVVTHNLAQARRIADDVAVLWVVDGVGRLIESGPAARVFESPADPLTAAYVRGLRG